MDYQSRYPVERTRARSIKAGDYAPFLFFSTTILLTAIGLVMLYSASYNEALSFGREHSYFFNRQLRFALLALLPMLVVHLIPEEWIYPLSTLFLVGIVALLLLTVGSSFGQQKFGSRRWLAIGSLPSLQPSEFAKLALALFYGSYFVKRQKEELTMKTFLIPATVGLGLTALVLATKDYSSAFLLFGQAALTLVAAGLQMRYLVLLGAFAVPPALLLLFSHSYRVRRIAAFLLPTLDPRGINYQVGVSLKAIRRGGIFGVGVGNGIYKQGILPEVHSDFIFASIAEEIGFIGVLLIFALFIAFALFGYKAAQRCQEKHRFFSLTAFSLTTMVLLQAFLNLAVVTALLPPTGIPLPFFSQGGTSLFVILISSAFIHRALKVGGADE